MPNSTSQNKTSNPNTNPSPEMDPIVWSHLPEELLFCILSFLSPKSIFNLRSTCKRFKSLLFDPFFISKYSFSSSSSSSSFFLLSHPHFNRHFPLYDVVSGLWRQSSSASRSLLNPCTSSSSLLSSSNGLLCFYLPSSFLVVNPLSRGSTVVDFPELPFSFEVITLVSLPTGFKIFAASSNFVFLYDSKSKLWKCFDGFESILNDSFHQGGIHRNGCLYFTVSDPFAVVCFDLETGSWGRRFDDPLPANELAFIRVVASQGESKMYIIGGVGGSGISRCLVVWELDQETEDGWVYVETLPELMYKKFVSVCYHNYEHIYCFWHQGLICICCYTWPEILYYRVSRRTWHWLPKYPSLPEKWSCGFRWFSFLPNLHAPV